MKPALISLETFSKIFKTLEIYLSLSIRKRSHLSWGQSMIITLG